MADRTSEQRRHATDAGPVEARGGVHALQPLDALNDFTMADDEPDVRGWAVHAADGRTVGTVHDLLVDTAARAVRYLDVEVDRAGVRAGEHRHVLVPIGVARLDDDRDVVRLPTLAGADVARLPRFEHGALTRDEERRVLAAFQDATRSPASRPGPEGDFYDRA